MDRTKHSTPSWRGIARGSFRRGGGLGAAAGLLLAIAACLSACSGTIQTTQGPRPATEVVAQDTAADVLSWLKAGYVIAVRVHDERVSTDTVEVHAAHGRVLRTFLPGLKGAGNALEGWKAGTSGAPTAQVLCPLGRSLPQFLELAGALGALPPDKVQRILAFARPILEVPCV